MIVKKRMTTSTRSWSALVRETCNACVARKLNWQSFKSNAPSFNQISPDISRNLRSIHLIRLSSTHNFPDIRLKHQGWKLNSLSFNLSTRRTRSMQVSWSQRKPSYPQPSTRMKPSKRPSKSWGRTFLATRRLCLSTRLRWRTSWRLTPGQRRKRPKRNVAWGVFSTSKRTTALATAHNAREPTTPAASTTTNARSTSSTMACLS